MSVLSINNPLQSHEQRLALHLDQTPLAVIDWDTEYCVNTWNKAAEKIFGYSLEEAIGISASKLINSESIIDEVNEKGKKLFTNTGSTRGTNENIRKDGKIIVCEWYNTSIVDNNGNVIGISSIVMDITERKKDQDLLHSQDSLLRAFSLALPDVSLIYDEDGKYVKILAAEENLLTTKSEVMMGMSIFDILPEKLARGIHTVILKTIETKKPQIYEYKLNLQSGETWFEARTSPMDKKVNEKSLIVWLAHDITIRKNAEDKIRELLLEKEMILKEVHHRIKNNMHIISCLLNMQSNKINNPEFDSAFQDAISRIDSMGFLYDKLYRSENYETLGVKQYLSELIEEVLQIFPEEKKIKLELEFDNLIAGPSIIFPLGIIINEILTNIMKYAFQNKDSGFIQVILKNNKGNVTLSIKDNGCGFPDSFDNTEQDGFGISLIRILVEQLDGSLKMGNDNGAKSVIEFSV
jgi:PAS domain S-box-containing protein